MGSLNPLLSIPLWVHRTRQFQETPLLNRGVLDAIGSSPYVLLARNPIERKERLLDRALVIGSAFFLAPLHGWLFLKLFSRNLPSQHLMRVSFTQLKNNAGFKKGLSDVQKELRLDSRGKLNWKIPTELLKGEKSLNEIRKRLITNKLHMLRYDLITEALIFANIGYFKNWVFTQAMGRNQFTGEYGIAQQEKLDQLHQYNAQKVKPWLSEKGKFILNNFLAITAPLLTVEAVKKTIQSTVQTKSNTVLAGFMRKNLHWFDYNKAIFMGLGPMFVVVMMQFMGALMAARDKYERREVFIRENLMNYIFFFGNYTWMKSAQVLFRLPKTSNLVKPLSEVIKTNAGLSQLAKLKAVNSAKQTAAFYWGCFGANTASLAAAILGNNYLTQKIIKRDIQKMEAA